MNPTSALYKDAFQHDPVVTYLLNNFSVSARQAYLLTYFQRLLGAAGLNAAEFLEADDWASAAVIMPPGSRVDNLWTLIPAGLIGMVYQVGLRGSYRMLGEYVPLADSMKAKGLRGWKRYYYVFYVATKEEERGRGLSSALLRQVQDGARREGLPVWLEATTVGSMRLYASLGFETVGQVTLGEGIASADGTQKKGGEGVPVWGMVWWPKQEP